MIALQLLAMFEACKPRDGEEWDSEEVVAATNKLFDHLAEENPAHFGEKSPFIAWCLKATTEEQLNQAFRLWGFGKSPRDRCPDDVAALRPEFAQ